jgi:hypothetical protein
MGGMFSSPSIPPSPPPPPPPERKTVAEEGRKEREKLRKQKGVSSNILTSPQGAGEEGLGAAKTLLGE